LAVDAKEKLPTGATMVAVICVSDMTQLPKFPGNQPAWPQYLTIGNI
jgi:hypothetical protein